MDCNIVLTFFVYSLPRYVFDVNFKEESIAIIIIKTERDINFKNFHVFSTLKQIVFHQTQSGKQAEAN